MTTKAVKKMDAKFSPEELEALGLYFTVSNAGQDTREAKVIEYAKKGEWKRISALCNSTLEGMAMDAGSIGMSPDSLYSELRKEAKGWARDAAKGNKYVVEEWTKLKGGGR